MCLCGNVSDACVCDEEEREVEVKRAKDNKTLNWRGNKTTKRRQCGADASLITSVTVNKCVFHEHVVKYTYTRARATVFASASLAIGNVRAPNAQKVWSAENADRRMKSTQ